MLFRKICGFVFSPFIYIEEKIYSHRCKQGKHATYVFEDVTRCAHCDLEIINSTPVVKEDGQELHRGWYIRLDKAGCFYLNKNGIATLGVGGFANSSFWKTEEEAKAFLTEWEAI